MSSPISGFTAIPNPQMLAFMPIQSYLMMYFAGAGWQIGKRKISAIPNDEFNKMSAKELLEGFTADLRETIPTLERSLNDITPLIETLIKQYGDFARLAFDVIPKVAHDTASDIITNQFTKEGTLSKLIIEVVGGGTAVGGGTGSKALLFAQKQLQDEVDRLKAEKASLDIGVNADPNRFKPSTISGLSIQQAKEQARQKQLQHELELREKAKFSRELAKTEQPVFQKPLGFTRKRPAGQSQRLERTKLIKQIAESIANQAKTPASSLQHQKNARTIRYWQQLLINLLSRYTF